MATCTWRGSLPSGIPQRLPGLERRHLGGRDCDGLSRSGIPPLPLRTTLDGKATEPGNADRLPSSERIRDGTEHGVDCSCRVRLREGGFAATRAAMSACFIPLLPACEEARESSNALAVRPVRDRTGLAKAPVPSVGVAPPRAASTMSLLAGSALTTSR